MNINATIAGELTVIFAIVVAVIGFRLARRKTRHPYIIALVGLLVSLFPPFGLVYLFILALKDDLMQPESET